MREESSDNLESADVAKREIQRIYNKDPRKWHILSGRDSHGYNDLVVMHGSDLWIIKEQLINPYKSVGFAVKTVGKTHDVENIESCQYGVRPVTRTQIDQIVETINSGRIAHEVLSEIMNRSPVSIHDVMRSPAAIQGPVVHVNRPGDLVSTKQCDLDLKLKVELEKLLMRKYRQTVVPYI